MKKTLLTLTLLLGLASSPLYADHHHNRQAIIHDHARVLAVTPLIDIVRVPKQVRDCRSEKSSHTRHSAPDGTGMIVGTILGGVIGHQVGQGDGRKVATVAGSIIGAAIGHDIDRNKPQHPIRYTGTEHHCNVHTHYIEQERIRGYRVTYKYRGETFTTTMDEPPGKFINVRVAVRPSY